MLEEAPRYSIKKLLKISSKGNILKNLYKRTINTKKIYWKQCKLGDSGAMPLKY